VTRAVLALAALLAAGCATTPQDPFVAAERALQRHDLAMSLRALDAVPVAHARYPEARAAAVDVERSMRRCHELMLEAMLLRSEWRDREALAALRKAESIWPRLPGLDALIAATEHRQRVLGGEQQANRGPAPAATPAQGPAAPRLAFDVGVYDVPTEPSREPPAAPAGELRPSPAAASAVSEAPEAEAPATPAVVPPGAPQGTSIDAPAVTAEPRSGEDPVALGLVAVETRLARNQLEPAVADLLELSRRFPADARVRLRLVRLLHQRALLHYGEGAVAMAVADWRRLLEIDPTHAPARRMLDAVEREGR
jgi:hypothetical protein